MTVADENLTLPPPAPKLPDSQPPRRRRVRWGMLIGAVLLIGAVGAFAWHARGRGYLTAVKNFVRPPKTPIVYIPPTVVLTRPVDGTSGVPVDAEIVAEVKRALGGLEAKTARSSAVRLIQTDDQIVVPTTVRIERVSDMISRLTLKPNSPLKPGTNYTFYIGEGLQDRQGGRIVPSAIGFWTAADPDPDIAFQKLSLPAAKDVGFTGVLIDKERILYACTDDGRIFKFPILDTGNLGPPSIINSLVEASGGPRHLSGLCFDPKSTPEHPIIWVTHSHHGFTNVPDWSGKVSRMSGKNFELVHDAVINLPRSVRDHLTNQPSFGPDGALYFPQPSNTAMGAPDNEWGQRPERLLNATVLRLDVKRFTPGNPIDARTPDSGGSYDPFAPNAPLTIHAFGVRLAYDLVWADDGHLYAPVNGSAAGGNTPAGGQPGDQPLSNVPISEDDWLFRILPGRYYGHPNPHYGHYILNGANPTAEYDFAEVPHYKVGTQPDPKWERAVHVFGKHVSANGVIQYKSDTFGGKLRGRLLVCRYNVPGDIGVLRLDGSRVVAQTTKIPGFTGFTNPLDLTEDPANGNIYVTEYGAQRITLLRVKE